MTGLIGSTARIGQREGGSALEGERSSVMPHSASRAPRG